MGQADGSMKLGWSRNKPDIYDEDWNLIEAGEHYGPTQVGDMDGDGILDIVVIGNGEFQPNNHFETFIDMLRGKGDGTFEDPVTVVPKESLVGLGGETTEILAVADFNADGLSDLLVNYWPPMLLVLLRQPGGAFGAPLTVDTGVDYHYWGAIPRDINGDGILDLAAMRNAADGCVDDSCLLDLTVLYGLGDGWFSPPETIRERFMEGVLVDDFNRDGAPDFLIYGGGWLSPGLEIVLQTPPDPLGVFHRGDSNDDGKVDISDGVRILNFLFLGGPKPTCLEAANANDDAVLNISDAVYLFQALFTGGPKPPAPGAPPAECGADPVISPSALGCKLYIHCQ